MFWPSSSGHQASTGVPSCESVMKFTLSSRYRRPLGRCIWDIILRSAKARYYYILPFFNEISQGDLLLMNSCVFWCEFIDLVDFLALLCSSWRELGTPVGEQQSFVKIILSWFCTYYKKEPIVVTHARTWKCIANIQVLHSLRLKDSVPLSLPLLFPQRYIGNYLGEGGIRWQSGPTWRRMQV